ncbi:MAG: PD40 domain-containing protein [Planctomycetes bacterium]|nr:PD40 domain-containing protein [Planctomycetota bacterium]
MSLADCFALLPLVLVPQGEPRTVARLPDGIKLETGSLRFARGGKQAAYVGHRGDEDVWVVGETVGDTYDQIEPPVFDASGAHVSFRVRSTDKKGREVWSLILDGKKVATNAWIGPVAFSPVDGTPAYWSADRWETIEDMEKPALAILMAGKKKSGRFELAEMYDPPVFSQDGRYVFSHAWNLADDRVVVLDLKGKESSLHIGEVQHLAVNPSGTEVVCTIVHEPEGLDAEVSDEEFDAAITHVLVRAPVAAKAKGPKPVVIGSRYESAGRAQFSPDGEHVAFRVSRGFKVGVALDSDANAAFEYDLIGEVAFDPSGTHVAYVAVEGCTLDADIPAGFRVLERVDELEDGKWRVVYGGTQGPEFLRTALPRWSPDGSRLAYAAETSLGWRVYVGEQWSDAVDVVAELEWSPDGKTVWIGGRRGFEFVWTSFVPD